MLGIDYSVDISQTASFIMDSILVRCDKTNIGFIENNYDDFA